MENRKFEKILRECAKLHFDELTHQLSDQSLFCSVIYEGNILFEEHYRTEHRNHVIPMNSVTKFYTGFLCLLAVKEKKLDLDESVQKYIGKIKLYWGKEDVSSKVTIRMLLMHTSGLLHEAKIGNNFIPCNDRKEYIHSIDGETLLFEPGTDYLYSNIGYNICGMILEELYNDKLENIFLRVFTNENALLFSQGNRCMIPSSGMMIEENAISPFLFYTQELLEEYLKEEKEDPFTKLIPLWKNQQCGYGLGGKIYACGKCHYLITTGTDQENYFVQVICPKHKLIGVIWSKGEIDKTIAALEKNDILFEILCKLENMDEVEIQNEKIPFSKETIKSYVSYDNDLLYIADIGDEKRYLSLNGKKWNALKKREEHYESSFAQLFYLDQSRIRINGPFIFGTYFQNNNLCEKNKLVEFLCNAKFDMAYDDELFLQTKNDLRKQIHIIFLYFRKKLCINKEFTLKQIDDNRFQMSNGKKVEVFDDYILFENLKFFNISNKYFWNDKKE